MKKRVLLIGRNNKILSELKIALEEEGIIAEATDRIEQVGAEFKATNYDLIAFGRGVDEATNAQLRAAFRLQHKDVLFVNGLAPIIPLLVQQIKFALVAKSGSESVLTNFTCRLSDGLWMNVTVTQPAQLLIDLYQLDAIYTTHQRTLVRALVEAGSHDFDADFFPEEKTLIKFLVAEVNGSELAVLPLQ